MILSIFLLLKIFITILCASALAFQASEPDDTEEEHPATIRSSSTVDNGNTKSTHHYQYGHNSGSFKGDTTVPTSSRYTSARAYVDDKRRDGYRYYGTGSKSGNSFMPTNLFKSTSALDSHNYFVTTKSNLKDLEAAGSGISSGTEGQNNYLTVYESPALMNTLHGGNTGSMSIIGMDENFGDMASETGHGGGGYGGGGGHGGGGGGKGCNSALGLLGVLGLAAYLQNVLRNMQNGTAGRRKRDVSFDNPHDMEAKLEKVRSGMADLTTVEMDADLLPLNETSKDMKLDEKTYKKVMRDVFPLLSAVAHAKDGLIPIHCTHSSVCLANQVLVRDLGYLGRSIGIRISIAIAKLLTKITKDERAEQIRMIHKAGKMGRNGRKCLKVFPTCHRLHKLPTYNIPTILESHNTGHSDIRSKSKRSVNKISSKDTVRPLYPKTERVTHHHIGEN